MLAYMHACMYHSNPKHLCINGYNLCHIGKYKLLGWPKFVSRSGMENGCL